jgi:hypothetical protein
MRRTKCSALQDKACDKLSQISFLVSNKKMKLSLENDHDKDTTNNVYVTNQGETYTVDQTVLKRAVKSSFHIPIQTVCHEHVIGTKSPYVHHTCAPHDVTSIK